MEVFQWLRYMENTKPLALVIFFVTFLVIIIYIYSNKKRSKRLESYKHIPFDEEAIGESDKKGEAS